MFLCRSIVDRGRLDGRGRRMDVVTIRRPDLSMTRDPRPRPRPTGAGRQKCCLRQFPSALVEGSGSEGNLRDLSRPSSL